MSPSRTDAIATQNIAGAGRGVIALRDIPNGTRLMQSGPPACHAIFRQYKKEVCARCFFYDRGKSLPVRLTDAGKVFCNGDCRAGWEDEQGETGMRAWQALHKYVQSRRKDITNSHGLPGLGAKPDAGGIDVSWARAEDMSKTSSERRKVADKQSIDPDVLSYLLSCALCHRLQPQVWTDQVMHLAMDNTPFRSQQDLDAYLSSFLQLTHICHLDKTLQQELLPFCTPEVLQAGIAAASHNSFGIRDEDGEEYMGYALYPTASYFNHSCDANVAKVRVGREWIFTAKRDIAAGEECCITYLGGDEDELSVDERRARTREHWGFECGCGRCRGAG